MSTTNIALCGCVTLKTTRDPSPGGVNFVMLRRAHSSCDGSGPTSPTALLSPFSLIQKKTEIMDETPCSLNTCVHKKVVLDIYVFVHLFCRIRLFLNTSKEVDVGFCALNTTEAVSLLIGKTNLTVSAVFKPLSFKFGMNSSIKK